jgi:type IV pilus assembly protein PilF
MITGMRSRPVLGLALALREFLTAASLDPKNPRIQYALGEAYLAQQKPEEAEQHYLKALELHPDHHDARLSLSAFYIVRGRYEESIAACEILIDDPTFSSPWRALANRGWSEYRLGQPIESRRSLELAIEYAPQYWPAMLSLAVLESDEGHRLEAIGLLQEVIALEPGARAEAEANYRLAENYIALGKRGRAVNYLTTAVARAPDGEWARRSQEYLKLLR